MEIKQTDVITIGFGEITMEIRRDNTGLLNQMIALSWNSCCCRGLPLLCLLKVIISSPFGFIYLVVGCVSISIFLLPSYIASTCFTRFVTKG